MNKLNYLVIFFKKIYLLINSLLEKYLNKLNFKKLLKKNPNFLQSNKAFLTFFTLIVLIFFYLSIPHIYNKSKIHDELKNQIYEKFSINFIFSKNFNYKFLPRPHFIIYDSQILDDGSIISDVKKLKIYISLDKLFSLKDITIKEIVIENSNFNLNKKNYHFFIKLLNNNFLEKILKIENSNIFYHDNNKDVLFLNRIIKMKYYYDSNNLKNIIYSENEIFNIPYSYEIMNDKKMKKIFSKINFKLPKLQIQNELDYNNNKKRGFLNLIFNKNKSKFDYEFNEDYFIFNFFDKLANPNFTYEGKINFKPFYSSLNGKLDKINLTSFFDSEALFIQLLKTEVFNNQNLNIDLNINANKITKYHNFVNLFLNSKIEEGLIDIDNTKLDWSNFVNFKISDSLIYINKNQLILDGKLILDIQDIDNVYKFLLTPKKYRSKIRNMELNFNYNFDQKIMILNDIKIDNKKNNNVNKTLKNLLLRNDKLQNKIYLKKKINEAIRLYAG